MDGGREGCIVESDFFWSYKIRVLTLKSFNYFFVSLLVVTSQRDRFTMVSLTGPAPNLNLLTDHFYNGFIAILQLTLVAHWRRWISTPVGYPPTLSSLPNMDFAEPRLIDLSTRPAVALTANPVRDQFSTYARWQDVLRRRGTVELPRAVKALMTHQYIVSGCPACGAGALLEDLVLPNVDTADRASYGGGQTRRRGHTRATKGDQQRSTGVARVHRGLQVKSWARAAL